MPLLSRVPDDVRKCREWTMNVAAGSRNIAATAYSYLLRQLKCEDNNRVRVLDLLKGARAYHETSWCDNLMIRLRAIPPECPVA